MEIFDEELKLDRANDLDEYNGIKRVFLTLEPVTAPDLPGYALLDVEFFNSQYLDKIDYEINVNHILPTRFIKVTGGSKIVADIESNQLQVEQLAYVGGSLTLQIKINGVGDYSRYTLFLEFYDNKLDSGGIPIPDGDGGFVQENKIDPLFSMLVFKFRPGCFNSNCKSTVKYKTPSSEPIIDYLARDFNSFKHLLINAMSDRIPGWQPTSEADLDQVLIDLIAADADELSDYQDRIMNEAYIGRARKRVAITRHARLMDYHVHQGNQASTVLALKMEIDDLVPAEFSVWTGTDWIYSDSVIFVSTHQQQCFVDLNSIELYTWDSLVTALEINSISADILSPIGTAKADAEALVNILFRDDINRLVIEEAINPESGNENGRDKSARQLLHLLDGSDAAELRHDPVNDIWYVHIKWYQQDRLKRRYCFTTQCKDRPLVNQVSTFHGNIISVTQGRPYKTVFKPKGQVLAPVDDTLFLHQDELHYESDIALPGIVTRLPNLPLAYTNTATGGDVSPVSTLNVKVSGITGAWEERIDLIGSESEDMHYMVETDEYDVSFIRFGNNTNGRALPPGASIECHYQVGRGSGGNVGADTLTNFDTAPLGHNNILQVWNPLDVTDGRDAELPVEIIRRAPEAYRVKQLRAVTLEDYVKRAKELVDVSHAYARYVWTGSWRSVQIAIDPKGTTDFNDVLREKIASHLNAVRLIGEDLEIRHALYVPLDCIVRLCAHPHYWPEDLAFELEDEFSDGFTTFAKKGFFHPDEWTFGQPLYASEIIGRCLQVKGVERVLTVSMRRWFPGSGDNAKVININPDDIPDNVIEKLEVKPFEIIQLANDPNQLDKGRIQFDILGGRR